MFICIFDLIYENIKIVIIHGKIKQCHQITKTPKNTKILLSKDKFSEFLSFSVLVAKKVQIMKNKLLFTTAGLILLLFLFTIQSCNKDDEILTEKFMNVSLPKLEFKHNKYYSIDYDERSIEMVFSEELDEGTINNCIFFTHNQGDLNSYYDLEVAGKILWMKFHSDFELKDGWKYLLTISTSLKSVAGESLRDNKTIELRTTSRHIGSAKIESGKSKQRTIIACISDIHMGDPRANENHYSWFGKNAEALEDFLEFINTNNEVSKLAILGDLFDEWLVPYTVNPFDPQSGITSSEDYYKAIANYSVNKPIVDKLRDIANKPEIDLLYVQGNHDMLLTKAILEEIIPGIKWETDVTGIGLYKPVSGIVMEHGHRYDFFNCPQPLVNQDHMLPPGYFISRLYAAGMEQSYDKLKQDLLPVKSSFEFITAWNLAVLYTLNDFQMDMPDMNLNNVLMGGIDGYNDPFSFNGAMDMYSANIEDIWPQTQNFNEVPVPLTVFSAILNGTELYDAALTEYMQASSTGSQYRVVAFGHSHYPEILVHPPENYTCIYGNSGSWIDEDQSSHKVRTFLTVEPGEWSGSELDVVMLYQYNLNNDTTGVKYKAELLAEDNIDKD